MPKAIMIIGAGPGIGQAVARRFGRGGWTIVLSARSRKRLTTLVAELQRAGIKAHAIEADATDAAALRAAITEADRLTGGLTAIHFNAAVVRQQDLFSMTDDEVAQDLAINVAGGLNTIRAAVAQFGTRAGTILVTGGGLGITPHEGWASPRRRQGGPAQYRAGTGRAFGEAGYPDRDRDGRHAGRPRY